MGGEINQRCEFGFNDNRFIDATFEGEPKGDKVLEIILEILQRDKKKIDVRVVEGSVMHDENVFLYPQGDVYLADDFSKAKKFYCKGHMPGGLKESLKIRDFKLDEEGRVINTHDSTCCAGCEYHLRG